MDEDKKINRTACYIGLSAKDVERSRRLHGRNVLTPAKRRSWWELYIEKYNDPIIRILLVASIISFILAFFGGNLIETLGIIIAIILATTIGFVFELDASRKFDVLTQLNEDLPVKVRRDGNVMSVPRQDIVVGDIVILDTGDEVPADGCLFEAIGLMVNESSLTGEPLSEKSTEATDDEGTYPRDHVYRSTMVMDGRGVMRVTAVGDSTEIGHVASKAMETAEVETPLNRQLKRLAKQISIVGSIISGLVFLTFLFHDYHVNNGWAGYTTFQYIQTLLKYFMVALTLIVMAVPEGLPMAVTLSLALNMRRMLRSNNLVRRLHASETMGAVTVICTDKTGTLTQNRMVVSDVCPCNDTDKDMLALAISANSTAELDARGDGIGNPTEVALLSWMQKEDIDYKEIRKEIDVCQQIPFSSERKYMLTTIRRDDDCYCFIKGAPEVIISMCAENQEEEKIQGLLHQWQHQGMRTLALAYMRADYESITQDCLHSFTLQAIVSISDPIRSDVPNAIEECYRAGIDVKIITGDTSATAIEIARQIGIIKDNDMDGICITGAEFATLSDEEALQRVRKILIMSRARPTDKERFVRLLEKCGEVVAVTGDGTNDAPALNHAHVGLSLGSGTSVAKEASDITLIDDSFHSIVKAVMWGRSLYRNLQRFLFFQLVVNVAALLSSLFCTLAGNELPLTVTQILWINLIMDTLASLALSSLPPSHEVMNDKPRRRDASIITQRMAWGIATVGVCMFLILLALLKWYGNDGEVTLHELTIFFTVFVMMQFWNLFNAKTLNSHHSAFHRLKEDGGLILVLNIILLSQWLIVTFGGNIFRTEPLSLTEWLWIILATSSIMIIGEACKWIQRMKHNRV